MVNAIETNNLTKKYDDLIAVNNLNLTIKEGELFSLLGLNGAGKTTTIKMLSCLLKPTNGDALILGNSIIKDSSKIKNIINVSPQETAVAPNLTVRENLELVAEIYGDSKIKAIEKAKEMATEFNLDEVYNKYAKKLSGGTMRRLSIAMALISEPKILFLDEPTLGLDVLKRRELWNEIEKLKGEITIILTTHYMEEAEKLSDRVGIMVDGNLKAVGTVKELINKSKKDSFEEAFISLASKEN